MNNSLYFINAKKNSEILLSFGEWICAKNLTLEFLKDLKRQKYKVAFINQENIFSHGMNVLRKVLFESDIIAVIGIQEIFTILQNANYCKINITDDLITIEDTEYKFRKFNFLHDTSETIEFNIDTEEICYKPDYYYCNELAPIIVKGYNMTSSMLPSYHTSRCDDQGRIWDKGFVFPSQFFDYFSKHMEEYYSILLRYITVLKSILSCFKLTDNSEKLKNLLALHYSYSIIFSFLTPSISEELKKTVGNDSLEQVYNLFVAESPIHNKYYMIDNALEKMEIFLENILNGVKSKDNYRDVYQTSDIPMNSMAIMYFVTNMFSDIRRCVINITIESNPWFEASCCHRKKVKIY